MYGKVEVVMCSPKTPPFDYIKNYYKVPAEFGRDVLVAGRKGTIVEDMGHHVGIIYHDDRKKRILHHHPTSEIEYLETITNPKELRPKNHRSQQRYLDYLAADSDLSFAQWLGIKPKK